MGLDAPDVKRDIAFCSHVLLDSAPDVLFISDASKDPRFCNNPLVIDYPHIRFYAGTSLRVNGVKIGTVCVSDRFPRTKDQFGEREALMLQDVAAC